MSLPSVPSSSWSAAQEQIILEPYTYMSQYPGKEIRTRLIDAFDVWLQVPAADLEVIRKVVRMLHNASLLWVRLCEEDKAVLIAVWTTWRTMPS